MTVTTTYPNKHIPFLDGLRGLAIILVLLYHCFPNLSIAKFGWVGVDLFFILSGFLITGILLDTKQNPHYFKNFFIRRALRIFPLYYLLLILVFFIIPVFSTPLLGNLEYYQQNQIYFWAYIQNWLYSVDGFPENFTLHHLWSLGVEEQFYIFWPFIVYFCNQKFLIKATIILIIFSIIFRHYGHHLGLVFPYQYVHILSRMDALLLGALVLQLFRISPNLLKKLSIPVLILTTTVIIVYIGVNKTVDFWYLTPIYTFIGLFFASIIAVLICDFRVSVPAKLLLSNAILNWFGKYSYGLYIIHYPLYFIGLKYLSPTIIKSGFSVLVSGLINGLACIFFSCILAYISFNLFEVKFINLKERFTKR